MTNQNLIDAPWLPVKDRGGSLSCISPAQVVADQGRRYVALASPRADFDGALSQFLIGLLQTAFMPEDDSAWARYWHEPPAPEELAAAFARHTSAFELGGDGPRFMQDLTLNDGETKPIAGLLLDAPGGNTVRNNQDHFIKRDIVAALCPHCAAMALFALQTNAPSGGQGHRVGLRGGGPLTTLLEPRGLAKGELGLWHLLWLNVLPARLLQDETETETPAPEAIFPWLAATRTSEKNQKVTPIQAHPLQMYWGMPRRIRLDFAAPGEGRCDLCGQESASLLRQYRTRNFGVSYEAWRHVLSPHTREAADKPWLPVHGQPGGIGFRHWLGIAVADPEGRGKTQRQPAKVVSHASQGGRRRIEADIWAFGYDMDNMKARAWVESRMPLLLADEVRQTAFEEASSNFVLAANEAFGYLRGMVKSALYGDPKQNTGKLKWDFPPHVSIDTAFFDTLAGDYWRLGEPLFFARLRELLANLGHETEQQASAEAWIKDLAGLALAQFDQAVGGVEEADNRVKAVVFARTQLGRMLYGDSLRGLLYLPKREAPPDKPTKKGGKRG